MTTILDIPTELRFILLNQCYHSLSFFVQASPHFHIYRENEIYRRIEQLFWDNLKVENCYSEDLDTDPRQVGIFGQFHLEIFAYCCKTKRDDLFVRLHNLLFKLDGHRQDIPVRLNPEYYSCKIYYNCFSPKCYLIKKVDITQFIQECDKEYNSVGLTETQYQIDKFKHLFDTDFISKYIRRKMYIYAGDLEIHIKEKIDINSYNSFVQKMSSLLERAKELLHKNSSITYVADYMKYK